MKCNLEAFYAMIVATLGEAGFVEQFNRALKKVAARRGVGVTDLLDQQGLRSQRDRAADTAGSGAFDLRRFIEITRTLQLRVDVDYRAHPWDRWVPGSTFVLVIGERPLAAVPEGGDGMFHPSSGRHDVLAVREAMRLIDGPLQIDARHEIFPVPADLSFAEADDIRKKLTRRRDVGAVFVIGSTKVNPLVDPIARDIMQEGNEKLEPQLLTHEFRFAHRLRQQDEKDCAAYLCSMRKWQPHEEGIALRNGGRQPAHPRVHGAFIKEQIQQGVFGPFADCGMLLMSARPNEPVLGVAAGHGGCATIAAMLAIGRQDEIAEALLSEEKPQGRRNRVMGIVEVQRMKPNHSNPSIDDCDFDREYDESGAKGWRLGWLE